jgi:hypothetical protein
MTGGKLIMNLTPDILKLFSKANNSVSLRFCFHDPDHSSPITFFINCKVIGYSPYDKDSPNLQFLSLKFTHQPPEDLIGRLGLIIEANVNAKKRAEDRIILNEETIKALEFLPKASALVVNGIPRACIIRDISFSGARIIISGLGKFLVNKPATIRIEFQDLPQMLIPGEILRYEPVEGRKDLSTLAIKFIEDQVPISYRIKINDQMTKRKKTPGGGEVSPPKRPEDKSPGAP